MTYYSIPCYELFGFMLETAINTAKRVDYVT